MSDCSGSENVELYLHDNTVIPARVVKIGKVFTGGDDETAVVKLADTSVVTSDEGLHRAIAITNNGETHYQELTAAQEEQIITEACKRANLKIAFTRWLDMVKKDRYPADATPEEAALFGECLLSQTTVTARITAKRKRDAASRKRRALQAHGLEPVPKRSAPTAEVQMDSVAANVEMRIIGTPAAVRHAMQQLLS